MGEDSGREEFGVGPAFEIWLVICSLGWVSSCGCRWVDLEYLPEDRSAQTCADGVDDARGAALFEPHVVDEVLQVHRQSGHVVAGFGLVGGSVAAKVGHEDEVAL